MRVATASSVCTLLVAVGTLTAASAQSPEPTAPPKPATIQGLVLDGVSGSPIEGATVIADPSPQFDMAAGGGRSAMAPISGIYHSVTTANGAFTLSDVKLKRVQIRVHKMGYLNGVYGRLGPADTKSEGWLDIADAEAISGVVVRMWQTATISGVVRDDVGDPLVNVKVDVLGRVVLGGVSTWGTVLSLQKTDDRGNYKVAGLAPGDYLVAVPASTKAEAQLAPAHDAFFHPGMRSAGRASVITLAPGEQDTNADVVVSYRPNGQTYSITGTFIGADRPVDGVAVQLIPADTTDALAAYEGTSTSATDGAFRFSAVAPGEYRIRVCAFPRLDTRAGLTALANGFIYASPPGSASSRDTALWPAPSDARTWWADVPVAVKDQDLARITVPVQPGLRISGKVTFDDAAASPAAGELGRTPLFVRPVSRFDMDLIPQFQIGPDGRFTSIGLPPGSYALTTVFGIWKDWTLASVLSEGRETLGRLVELDTADVRDLTLLATKKKTTIEGTVRDADGKLRPEARVIVFSSNPASWNGDWALPTVTSYVVDRHGHYDGTILPGRYFAVAVTSLPALWTSPAFLESLQSQSIQFEVAVGEAKSVSVPVSRSR